MRKKTKLYAALACILVVCCVTGLVNFMVNKGVPAVSTASYVQQTEEPASAKELIFLVSGDNDVPGLKLVEETDELGLYFNQETTEFAVLNKRSGKLWRSNPADRGEDVKASSFEKEELSSQLSVTFWDRNGQVNTFSNFSQSISRNQFKAEKIEGGIRITYTMGDMSLGIDALPKLISKQRMEEKILNKLDEKEALYVSNRYYPQTSNPEILERLDTAFPNELVLQRILKDFQQVGYTAEDLAFDNEQNGIPASFSSDRPSFTIPLDLRIESGSLLVSVPVQHIEESKGYRISNINLLGFFGAAGREEQGYMLVPDGTGSLIYLNNNKTNAEVYAQRIYGNDENDNSVSKGQVTESVRLPVFGLKTGDEAWFASIEKGDAIASIHADVAGRNNSYNSIFSSFSIRGEDELELYKGTQVEEIQLLTEERYEGEISVRYHFLSGSEANYSGMAMYYRELLKNQGVLTPLSEKESMPFYLTVLGAVDKQKSFLGVPYKGMVSMTSFKEANHIAERLHTDGVENLQMRYLGWFNKGLNHNVPTKVEVEGALGSKGDFMNLANKLEAMGGKLYPDVAFQHVYQEGDGFTPASDAARFVTREEALKSPFNRSLNTMDKDLGKYYLLSPVKLPYYVERFMKSYAGIDNDALALRDLSDSLHADYRVNRVIFRETAKQIVVKELEKIKKQYRNILVAGGNAYSFAYADQLVNVPTSTSLFNITDEAVPFYQMVLHGYADYAGSPINLDNEQDMQFHLLRSLELGMAPHFLWTNESSSKLKFTPYDTFYSTEYTTWYDSAVKLYGEVNDILADLRTVPIAKHVRHAPGVVEVQYENGVFIYVNYTDEAVEVHGIRIDARNFTVGGGS
ncbi:DUF5696 domain-containing protein [Paenibacillus urinalis]|uniref:DUF5696 domain-containing protein n=1 Tax=Paenibacillus urinalis TaxID=521520 RepID=UPI0019608858